MRLCADCGWASRRVTAGPLCPTGEAGMVTQVARLLGGADGRANSADRPCREACLAPLRTEIMRPIGYNTLAWSRYRVRAARREHPGDRDLWFFPRWPATGAGCGRRWQTRCTKARKARQGVARQATCGPPRSHRCASPSARRGRRWDVGDANHGDGDSARDRSGPSRGDWPGIWEKCVTTSTGACPEGAVRLGWT